MSLAALLLALFSALFVVADRLYARWRISRIVAKHCATKTGSVAIVRHASLYVGGRKVGTMTTNAYRIDRYAPGKFATIIDADTIVTVDPVRTHDFADDLLNEREIDVTVGLIAGKRHVIRMRVTQAEFISDTKTGTLRGKFRFIGGVPKVEI